MFIIKKLIVGKCIKDISMRGHYLVDTANVSLLEGIKIENNSN